MLTSLSVQKLDYTDEEECPTVELEHGIDMRELISDKGTDFAVKNPEKDVTFDDGD